MLQRANIDKSIDFMDCIEDDIPAGENLSEKTHHWGDGRVWTPPLRFKPLHRFVHNHWKVFVDIGVGYHAISA